MANHCPQGYEVTTYIPIDFEKESLKEVLVNKRSDNNKYNPSAKTLFFWDGVSMYLDETAVDAVFGFVREHAAIGSLIVFDFVWLDYITSQGKAPGYTGGDRIFKACEQNGQPLTFGIPKGKLEAWLAERGFTVDKFWSGKDLEKKHDTNLFGQEESPSSLCIARLDTKAPIHS